MKTTTRYGLSQWWAAINWWAERRQWGKVARASLSLPKAVYFEAKGGTLRRSA